MRKLAIIGGTGVYDPALLSNTKTTSIKTPYGQAVYTSGIFMDKEIIFMTRHGANHTIPPHKINYRANIYALKMLDVVAIVATTAVGSLNPDMKPGEMVLVDQLLDFTKLREHTFYDGSPLPVAHVDLTEPYCGTLRKIVAEAAKKEKLPLHKKGTYVCTEGPRFETAGEIKMYAQLGGDVVGMTNAPECPLAREAEIAYTTVSLVTNFAAGISPQNLTHSEVVEAMEKNSEQLKKLLRSVMTTFDPAFDSPALHAMAEYGGFKVEQGIKL